MIGVRSRTFTSLIVFVAGCAAPRSIDVVEVAAQPAAPSASASAGVVERRSETGAHLCATFRREQNAPIEAALAGPVSPSDPLDSDSAREALTKLGNHCWPGKKSAWATKLDWVAPRPWDGYQGLTARVALVHLGADGQRGMIVPPPSLAGGPEGMATNAYFSSLDGGGIENGTAFDFDDDGDDELVLVLGGSYHEGESWSVGRVWTSKNGAVAEYPPAAGMAFLEARDVDKDGRPDLVDFGAYTSVLEGLLQRLLAQGRRPLAHRARDEGRRLLRQRRGRPAHRPGGLSQRPQAGHHQGRAVGRGADLARRGLRSLVGPRACRDRPRDRRRHADRHEHLRPVDLRRPNRGGCVRRDVVELRASASPEVTLAKSSGRVAVDRRTTMLVHAFCPRAIPDEELP